MSVSPTDDALIVALDLGGELDAACRQPLSPIPILVNIRYPQPGAFV